MSRQPDITRAAQPAHTAGHISPGRAFIGLGSNLPLQGVGDPVDILQQALRRIAAIPETCLSRWSSIYESEALPVSGAPQSRYANSVCEVATQLSPEALLTALQSIEQDFGRIRSGHRWSARTLDLDVLLFNELAVNTSELTIPHYAMLTRNFVLIPLLEIEPSLCFIDGRRLAELAPASDYTGLALLKRFTNNELALV